MIQGQRSMPVLSVSDVEKSSAFFTEGLGFSLAGRWQDDDGSTHFAIVVLDKITVGLSRSEVNKSGGPWAAYFYVADIDTYATQIAGNGVKLHREVMDRFYGCRDLDVEDLDGNLLCFGQDLSPGEDGPGL
jgi:predicted enzyme related to lactoylglutathione lyase